MITVEKEPEILLAFILAHEIGNVLGQVQNPGRVIKMHVSEKDASNSHLLSVQYRGNIGIGLLGGSPRAPLGHDTFHTAKRIVNIGRI
jgi:hypothetical protein